MADKIYDVEMEQGEREIYVKVTAEGEILP